MHRHTLAVARKRGSQKFAQRRGTTTVIRGLIRGNRLTGLYPHGEHVAGYVKEIPPVGGGKARFGRPARRAWARRDKYRDYLFFLARVSTARKCRRNLPPSSLPLTPSRVFWESPSQGEGGRSGRVAAES